MLDRECRKSRGPANGGRKTTPAMAAGKADHVWTLRAAGLQTSRVKLTHYPHGRGIDTGWMMQL